MSSDPWSGCNDWHAPAKAPASIPTTYYTQPAAVAPTPGVEEDELPAGWEKRYDERGELYYAKPSLGLSQWEHPEAHPTAAVQEDELPDGWEARHDEDSGFPYYLNKTLGKTQWERPSLDKAECERVPVSSTVNHRDAEVDALKEEVDDLKVTIRNTKFFLKSTEYAFIESEFKLKESERQLRASNNRCAELERQLHESEISLRAEIARLMRQLEMQKFAGQQPPECVAPERGACAAPCERPEKPPEQVPEQAPEQQPPEQQPLRGQQTQNFEQKQERQLTPPPERRPE